MYFLQRHYGAVKKGPNFKGENGALFLLSHKKAWAYSFV